MSSNNDLLSGGADSGELINRMKNVLELLKEEDKQTDKRSAMTLAKCSDYRGPAGPLQPCIEGETCKNLSTLDQHDSIVGKIYAYSEKDEKLARCVPVGFVKKGDSALVNNYQELLELLNVYATDVKPKLDELMQFMSMVTDCSILKTEKQCRSPLIKAYDNAPMCVWTESDTESCGGTCSNSQAYDHAYVEMLAKKIEAADDEYLSIVKELRKPEFATFSEHSNMIPMDPTVAKNYRLFKALALRKRNIEAKLAKWREQATTSLTNIKGASSTYVNMKALEAECARLSRDGESGKFNKWATCTDSGDICQVVHAIKEKDDNTDDKSRSGYITSVHEKDKNKTFNGHTSFCLPKDAVNITYAYNPDSGRVLFLDHNGKPTKYVDAAQSIWGAKNWAASAKNKIRSGTMAFFNATGMGNMMRIFGSGGDRLSTDPLDDELDQSLSSAENSAAKARLLQFRMQALYNQIMFYKNGKDGSVDESDLSTLGNKNIDHVRKLIEAYKNIKELYDRVIDELMEDDIGTAYRLQVFDKSAVKSDTLRNDLIKDKKAIHEAQRRALAQLNARYNFSKGEIITFHHAAAPSGGNTRGLTPWTEKNASNVTVAADFKWTDESANLTPKGATARKVRVKYQGQDRVVDAAYCKKIYESYTLQQVENINADFKNKATDADTRMIDYTGTSRGGVNREVLCVIIDEKPYLDPFMTSNNVDDAKLTKTIEDTRKEHAELDRKFSLHKTSSLNPLAWIVSGVTKVRDYSSEFLSGGESVYDVQSVSLMSTEGAQSSGGDSLQQVSLMSTEGAQSLMSTEGAQSSGGMDSLQQVSLMSTEGAQSLMSTEGAQSAAVSEYASTGVPSVAQQEETFVVHGSDVASQESFEVMSTEGGLSAGGSVQEVSVQSEGSSNSSSTKVSVDVDRLYEEFYANQFDNVSDGSSVSRL